MHMYVYNRQVYDSYSFVAAFLLALSIQFCVCSIREFYVITVEIIDKAWHHISTKSAILIG